MSLYTHDYDSKRTRELNSRERERIQQTQSLTFICNQRHYTKKHTHKFKPTKESNTKQKMFALDKENATSGNVTRVGVGPTSVIKQVDSVVTQPLVSALAATPKNSFNKLAMTNGNTTGKRRALCEVTLNTANRNTTMGITPKFERTSIVSRGLGSEYTKPVVAKRIVDATPKIKTAIDDDLEPIERLTFKFQLSFKFLNE